MFSVAVPAPALPEVYDAGTLGIIEHIENGGDIEHGGWLEAFFEDREVAAQFGDPVACENTNWVRHTYDAWPPILAGERFFVVAPWRADPTPPGRFRLELNPGLQCGTGQHPCTRLCLEAMERVVMSGDSVLDVGTGSGILAIAAKLLGAGPVIACDIDPEAAKVVPFFVGSVDAVRAGAFDIVVANIGEEVLDRLHADLERVARRRILSGFQDANGEWACVVS